MARAKKTEERLLISDESVDEPIQRSIPWARIMAIAGGTALAIGPASGGIVHAADSFTGLDNQYDSGLLFNKLGMIGIGELHDAGTGVDLAAFPGDDWYVDYDDLGSQSVKSDKKTGGGGGGSGSAGGSGSGSGGSSVDKGSQGSGGQGGVTSVQASSEAEMTINVDCFSVSVTSSKDISNVVVTFADGTSQTFDGLSGNTFSRTFSKEVASATAKSGQTTVSGSADACADDDDADTVSPRTDGTAGTGATPTNTATVDTVSPRTDGTAGTGATATDTATVTVDTASPRTDGTAGTGATATDTATAAGTASPRTDNTAGTGATPTGVGNQVGGNQGVGNQGGGNQDHKIGICHATGSLSNPFVFIMVDEHAVKAHENHQDGRDIIGVDSADDCPPDGVDADDKDTVVNTVSPATDATPGTGATPTGTATATGTTASPRTDGTAGTGATATNTATATTASPATDNTAGTGATGTGTATGTASPATDNTAGTGLTATGVGAQQQQPGGVGGVIGFAPQQPLMPQQAEQIANVIGGGLTSQDVLAMTPTEVTGALGARGLNPADFGVGGVIGFADQGIAMGAAPLALPAAGGLPIPTPEVMGLGALLASAGALLRRSLWR